MDTLAHRKGEVGAIPFRTGRFFVVANSWYFSCREGMDKGPYSTRGEAEIALKAFLSQCDEVAEAMGS